MTDCDSTANGAEPTRRVVILGARIAGCLAAAWLKKKHPDLDVVLIGRTDKQPPVVGESLTEYSTWLMHEIGLEPTLRERHFPKFGLTFYFKQNINDPQCRSYAVHEAPREPPLPAHLINRFDYDVDVLEHARKLGVRVIAGEATDVELADGVAGHASRDGRHKVRLRRAQQSRTVVSTVPERNVAREHATVSAPSTAPATSTASENPTAQRAEQLGQLVYIDTDTAADTDSDSDPTIEADWIIDATGRRRFLSDRLGLKHTRPDCQRSVFWFRLKDFDPEILKRAMRAGAKPHDDFDPYFSAHHFFGHGNWVWCIPLPTEDGSPLMSIGLMDRPDLFPHSIRTIDDVLDQFAREHPVLHELVSSGTVVDTNVYNNYLYRAEQRYSEDGWFLIGDAADTTDALYSTGLVMLSIQITQIDAVIRRSMAKTLTVDFVRDLEEAYLALLDSTQNEISGLYEVMHDPYQSHWRMHITSATYFYFMLPMLLCDYHTDPNGARIIRFIARANRPHIERFNRLLRTAASRPDAWHHVQNRYNVSVNWNLTSANESNIPADLVRLLRLLVRFRLSQLHGAGLRDRLINLALCAADLLQALAVRVLFVGKPLRESRLFQLWIRLVGPTV